MHITSKRTQFKFPIAIFPLSSYSNPAPCVAHQETQTSVCPVKEGAGTPQQLSNHSSGSDYWLCKEPYKSKVRASCIKSSWIVLFTEWRQWALEYKWTYCLLAACAHYVSRLERCWRADGPVMMSRNSIHSTSALKQITKALFLVLGSCRQQEERMRNEMETNCVKLSVFLDLKLHSAFISLTMVQQTCYRHPLWFQLQLL